jgi:adenylylsulfate kinase
MSEKKCTGFAIYLTGLPSSGKSTLASALREALAPHGITIQILDSDEMRQILTPDPTYSSLERDWFYDVLAFIAYLLTNNNVNVIIAATAPLRTHRQAARSRVHRFVEVYLRCSPKICRTRDPKGLWELADSGEIRNLPGAGAPYEPPESPEICVDTERFSVSEAASLVMDKLKKQGLIM